VPQCVHHDAKICVDGRSATVLFLTGRGAKDQESCPRHHALFPASVINLNKATGSYYEALYNL